jgi:hypothetical protein
MRPSENLLWSYLEILAGAGSSWTRRPFSLFSLVPEFSTLYLNYKYNILQTGPAELLENGNNLA